MNTKLINRHDVEALRFLFDVLNLKAGEAMSAPEEVAQAVDAFINAFHAFEEATLSTDRQLADMYFQHAIGYAEVIKANWFSIELLLGVPQCH